MPKHPLHAVIFLSAGALTLAACSDSDGITVPLDTDFDVSVSGQVLGTGFDDATGDWWCQIEIVAEASGGDPGTYAAWAPSDYEFSHPGGNTWTDTWSVGEMTQRFGTTGIISGESRTTVRRFVSPMQFDVGVTLRWTLPDHPDPFSQTAQFDCF